MKGTFSIRIANLLILLFVFDIIVAYVTISGTFKSEYGQLYAVSKKVQSRKKNDREYIAPPPPRPLTFKKKNLFTILSRISFIRRQEERLAIESDPLLPEVETIIMAADARKAANMRVMRVQHLTEVTSYMVVVEGNSRPQNQAILLSVEDDMKEKFGLDPISKEGQASSGWLLLDYGSIIVHVMTPQARNFYKLERRWKDGEEYDINYLLGRRPTSSSSSVQRRMQVEDDEEGAYEDDEENEDDEGGVEEEAEGLVKDEEDPFWQ